MKTFLIIMMLWMSAEMVSAQTNYYNPKTVINRWSVDAGFTTTRSIRGWKTGFNVEITRNNRWSIGYFNLSGKVNNEFSSSSESTYRGAEVGYIFNPQNRLQLGMNLRVGLHEQQFISVLPGATAQFKISDLINVHGAAAYSDGFPHFSIGLGLRLYDKR